MARAKSIKGGRGLVGAALGRTAHNAGRYAVMATLTGSYGETVHRIVGGLYWHPLKCAERAVKLHVEKRYQNIEFVNLQTGARVPVTQIINH